jgi:hypothetical protein
MITLTIGKNVFLPAANKPSYIVIDRHTMKQAGKTIYATREKATESVDRRDANFGAVRYFVKAI